MERPPSRFLLSTATNLLNPISDKCLLSIINFLLFDRDTQNELLEMSLTNC